MLTTPAYVLAGCVDDAYHEIYKLVTEILRLARSVTEDVSSLPWTVYMLRCADGSLYTGIAVNMERRLAQHNGELLGGARYTRGRRPVKVVYQEGYSSRSLASKREAEIKKLNRQKKIFLLQNSSSTASSKPAGN